MALAQVHQPAPADARVNIEESIPIAAREASTLKSLAALADAAGPAGERLDAERARAWLHYSSLTGRGGEALWARARGIGLWKSAGLAAWTRPAVSAMGWRGLVALRVAA